MEMNVEQKIEGRVKRRNCNASNASNADVPEEIQIEILSRLPPKSLSRCKCVSKHWNDTLTIQAFWLRYSRSYDKHPKLAFVLHSSVWGKESVISFELNDDNTPKAETTSSLIRGKDEYFTDFIPLSNYFYMSNICNDLICLFIPSSTCVGLLNIKTRDFIRLPAITIKPVNQLFWYALGFDPVQQVFKVLNISYKSGNKECSTATTKAAILTVGSKYWNSIDYESLPSSVPGWSTNSLCLDGVIYYVHQNTIDNVTVITVVAFDLNREAFRDNLFVKTPTRHIPSKYYLTSLKECPTLFIWKMRSEVEQWTLFNHKNPNAAWKRRNFTHNFPMMVPYDGRNIPVAGGSTLLHHRKSIDSECSWYSLLYDLENFAIE
ncbi:putative F-box protein At1g32420 [Silene latifolia]|uniref:putative F-box protein At1g32420 n=1 Tax=Silene latifolia TaxID=37657 RepID=UPI003D76C6D2